MPDKTKILIVDDDKEFCDSMLDILEAKGYAVNLEHSAPAAIARVKKKFFNTVLMDINMPVVNDLETFKLIKKIRPETTIIMMTAFSIEDLIKEALQDGAFGCLYKSMDIDKLVGQVELAKEKGMLIVTDDDFDTREAFKDALGAKGYKVSTATTSKEAINLTKKRLYDILFIDIKLPPLNGLEFYLAIKEINPKVIAAIIGAYQKEARKPIEGALKKGAYICFTKPLDVDKILELMKDISRGRKKKG